MPELYLWPENVDAWSLFLRCQTQWLTRGMEGRAYALNYPGCEIVMRHCVPRKLRAKRFEQLQVMEQAALRGWGERAKREG